MKVKVIKDFPGAKVGDVLEVVDTTVHGKGLFYQLSKLEGEYVEKMEESGFNDGDDVFTLYSTGEIVYGVLLLVKNYPKQISRGFISKDRERLEMFDEFLQLRASNGGWIPDINTNRVFFCVKPKGYVMENFNNGDTFDYGLISSGNCYRTKEEAENIAPRWKAYFEKLEALSRKQA